MKVWLKDEQEPITAQGIKYDLLLTSRGKKFFSRLSKKIDKFFMLRIWIAKR